MRLNSEVDTKTMCSFIDFNTEEKAKNVLLQEGLQPENVHPSLLRSWLRSKHFNLDPFNTLAKTVNHDNQNEMNKLLIQIAKPYFNYYINMLSMSESLLILGNADAVLIYTKTENNKIKKLSNKHNVLANSLWDETSVGTNPCSIVLEEKKPILMKGHQHYSYCFHEYCTAASPIFLPKSQEIIGFLALVGLKDRTDLHSLGCVSMMSRMLEIEVDKRIGKGENNNLFPNKTFSFSSKNDVRDSIMGVIGKSPIFLSALRMAQKAANTELSVLLTGETGTGKEVLAKAIHNNSSRSQGPFVAVNCGAIPKELTNSELFGYMEGAFTGASRHGYPGRFEQANGGTIFLDEIGDAPYEVQIGLLRVLEEGHVSPLGSASPIPVNVRVLAATSRDLNTLIPNGNFRKDLYYRLAGISIDICPLRERKEDIPLLAEHFLDKILAKTGLYYKICDELIQAFKEYDWPGNIREFKNMIERLVALAENEELEKELFYKMIPSKKKTDFGSDPRKAALVEAIIETKGNITRAAEKLGVNRLTVYRRIKHFGIDKEQFKH